MENQPTSKLPNEEKNFSFWLWEFSFKPIAFLLITAIIIAAVTFPFQMLDHYIRTTFSENASLSNLTILIGNIFSILTANFFVFQFLLNLEWKNTPLGFSKLFSELGKGFLLGAVVFSAVILVSWMIGIYSVSGFYWNSHSTAETSLFIISNLIIFIKVGIAEEYLFRAGMFQLFENTWGTWTAVISSSLFFGFTHLGNPHATWMGAIAIAFEAGIFLGAAYMLTRKIWFVAGIHWAWNFFQGPVYGNVISGSSSTQEGLFTSTMTGNNLLTGGIFGPEAGLPAIIICTSVGIYFLARTKKAGLFKKSIL